MEQKKSSIFTVRYHEIEKFCSLRFSEMLIAILIKLKTAEYFTNNEADIFKIRIYNFLCQLRI